MVDVDRIVVLAQTQGITAEEICKTLEITHEQLERRLKEKTFYSNEIDLLVDLLGIKKPGLFFYV